MRQISVRILLICQYLPMHIIFTGFQQPSGMEFSFLNVASSALVAYQMRAGSASELAVIFFP